MKMLIQLSVMGSILSFLIFGLTSAWSDDEHDFYQQSIGVDKVQSSLYTEECGDCHMAYPAGLLPANSWRLIMMGLADHFGDNAELEQSSINEITTFLTSNSADNSGYRRSKSMLRGLEKLTQTPIRISKLPYFINQHDELSTSMVKGNKQVGSFSKCNACHKRAEQGLFSENEISIPGYGAWDD